MTFCIILGSRVQWDSFYHLLSAYVDSAVMWGQACQVFEVWLWEVCIFLKFMCCHSLLVAMVM